MAASNNLTTQAIQEMVAAEMAKVQEAHRTEIIKLNQTWEQRLEAYKQEIHMRTTEVPDTEALVRTIQDRIDPNVEVMVQQHLDQGADKVLQDKIGELGMQAQNSAYAEAVKRVNRAEQSAFTQAILNEIPPPNFQMPKFNLFTGAGCPNSHLLHVKHQMALSPVTDALMCKIFVASLSEGAVNWFYKLPPGSITSYTELCNQFMAKYIHQLSTHKTAVSLFRMKIGDKETLEDFLQRFQGEVASVNNSDPVMISQAFIGALENRRNESQSEVGQCYWELLRKNPDNMTKILDVVHGWIIQEKEAKKVKRETNGDFA